MKKLLIIIPLIFWATVACSSSMVNVQFFDSSGKDYRTITLGSDVERHYGYQPGNPKVLLIEVSSLDQAEFKEQNTAFNQLGHEVEEQEVLIVIASPAGTYKHGYHTTMKAAKALSSDNSKFRIRLLNHSGVVIKSAFRPVSVSELRTWFRSR